MSHLESMQMVHIYWIFDGVWDKVWLNGCKINWRKQNLVKGVVV